MVVGAGVGSTGGDGGGGGGPRMGAFGPSGVAFPPVKSEFGVLRSLLGGKLFFGGGPRSPTLGG